jgi:hypothetical protein
MMDTHRCIAIGPWDIMITTEKNQSNFAKKSYDSKCI